MDIACGSKLKRKQKTLTLCEKVRIIDDFEGGRGTHESLGRKYGVGSSSVTRFIQQKDEIRAKVEHYREHGVDGRKTMKVQRLPLMEESLYVWVLQQREANIIVTSEALRVKGELLLSGIKKRGHYIGHNITFSDGWRQRFKDRHGLHVKRVVGEKASADIGAYLKFKDTLALKIIEMGLKNPKSITPTNQLSSLSY